MILLIALFVAGVYMFIHRGEESIDDASIDGRNVLLSSKVPGYVRVLNVNDNHQVKAGDVLLEIDSADYIFRRDHAKAALDAVKALTRTMGACVQNCTGNFQPFLWKFRTCAG